MERRLRHEIQQLHDAENDAILVLQDNGDNHDDLRSPHVILRGPRDSPYSDGLFSMNIRIPNNYPFQPPEVAFETMIWHPGVDFETGSVSLPSIIDEDWSPSWTLQQLLNELLSMLRNPNFDRPAANAEAAEMLQHNRVRFCETAKYWTKLYAGSTSEEEPDDESQQLSLQIMLDQREEFNLEVGNNRQFWDEVMAIELPNHAFVRHDNEDDTESLGSTNKDTWSMGSDEETVVSLEFCF